jgi:hypothetical protein
MAQEPINNLQPTWHRAKIRRKLGGIEFGKAATADAPDECSR